VLDNRLTSHHIKIVNRLPVIAAAWLVAFGMLMDRTASAAVVFLVNTTNQDTISASELSAWHSSLPLGTSLDFGLVTNPGTSSGTALMSQTVSTTINGQLYTLTTTEGGYTGSGSFASTVTGGATPGTFFSGFGTVNFAFENPASQDGDSSFGWGYDTGSSAPDAVASSKDTLRFDFTGSATPVRSFSASLIDLESSSPNFGYVVAYDTAGSLLGWTALDFGASTGDKAGHQFGLGVTDVGTSLGYVFVAVGDNTSGFAIGDIALGSTFMVPEPGRAVLLLGGALALVMRRRRGW